MIRKSLFVAAALPAGKDEVGIFRLLTQLTRILSLTSGNHVSANHIRRGIGVLKKCYCALLSSIRKSLFRATALPAGEDEVGILRLLN